MLDDAVFESVSEERMPADLMWEDLILKEGLVLIYSFVGRSEHFDRID